MSEEQSSNLPAFFNDEKEFAAGLNVSGNMSISIQEFDKLRGNLLKAMKHNKFLMENQQKVLIMVLPPPGGINGGTERMMEKLRADERGFHVNYMGSEKFLSKDHVLLESYMNMESVVEDIRNTYGAQLKEKIKDLEVEVMNFEDLVEEKVEINKQLQTAADQLLRQEQSKLRIALIQLEKEKSKSSAIAKASREFRATAYEACDELKAVTSELHVAEQRIDELESLLEDESLGNQIRKVFFKRKVH